MIKFSSFEIGRAENSADLEACAWLVAREYHKQGYADAPEEEFARTLSEYERMSVFFARRGGVISTTFAVMADSSSGLPIDELFKAELIQERRRGLLVEVGKLASTAKNERTCLYMTDFAFYVCFHMLEADTVCVSVNPRHLNLYRHRFSPRFLSAHPRPYPRVKNALAFGLVLSREEASESPYLAQFTKF